MNAIRTHRPWSRQRVITLVTAMAIALMALTPSVARAEEWVCDKFTVVRSIYIFGIHITDWTIEEGWKCHPK